MKKKFSSSIGRTIRLEQDVDKIVRESKLDISDLIEMGLISLAKQPGERRDKLLQETIRITEDRISYYSECLAELVSMKDQKATGITANEEKPKQKEHANILVKGRSGALYWTTGAMVNGNGDIFARINSDDATGDEEIIFSVDDIPSCELSEV